MYGFQAEMTNYRLPYQLRQPRRSILLNFPIKLLNNYAFVVRKEGSFLIL